MHINASDILAREVGASTGYNIEDETPELTDVTLTGPINGELRVVKTDSGLAAKGRFNTTVKLECHRCLREFDHPARVDAAGEFSRKPAADQWQIAGDGQIDIGPMVRQEIILNLPIKALCQIDCLGLCDVCGEGQETQHQHNDQPVPNHIRIIKG